MIFTTDKILVHFASFIIKHNSIIAFQKMFV